ncbi:MAG: hypothetical protein V3T31_08875 [candidate division Zixibacteria bacterium]
MAEKHKERKQFRKEIERFVERVSGESDIEILEVDIKVKYKDSNGTVRKSETSIYEFETGQ